VVDSPGDNILAEFASVVDATGFGDAHKNITLIFEYAVI
jgi:hypothetical protein